MIRLILTPGIYEIIPSDGTKSARYAYACKCLYSLTVLQFYSSQVFNAVVKRVSVYVLNHFVDRVSAVIKKPADTSNTRCLSSDTHFGTV